jgi:hypothetical protein
MAGIQTGVADIGRGVYVGVFIFWRYLTVNQHVEIHLLLLTNFRTT